jgi:hypothetical protein
VPDGAFSGGLRQDKDRALNSAVASSVESVLRDDLARADRALGGVAPVLGHVLAGSGNALVSDAVVARIRGMLNDLARQFAARLAAADSDRHAMDASLPETLAQQLGGDAPMLVALHASAMEGLITEKLDQRAAIDPVLSPLMQELVASQDAFTSETAMQALAGQSRFMQAQRRMQQPVLELSPEALERALRIWARAIPAEDEPVVTRAMRDLKAEYDEAQTRGGLIARLLNAMRGGAVAALELEHAGFALFTSALAQHTGQSRERAILACHDDQSSRLAVSLRAAGLASDAIERQFMALDLSVRPPAALEALSPAMARAMLHGGDVKPSRDGAR